MADWGSIHGDKKWDENDKWWRNREVRYGRQYPLFRTTPKPSLEAMDKDLTCDGRGLGND